MKADRHSGRQTSGEDTAQGETDRELEEVKYSQRDAVFPCASDKE